MMFSPPIGLNQRTDPTASPEFFNTIDPERSLWSAVPEVRKAPITDIHWFLVGGGTAPRALPWARCCWNLSGRSHLSNLRHELRAVVARCNAYPDQRM